MKSLASYLIAETLERNAQISFSLEDLERWDIWHANDDITERDCTSIVEAFCKEWPVKTLNGDRFIDNHLVKCRYNKSTVVFTIFNNYSHPDNSVVDIVKKIVDLLTEVVYSIGLDKDSIKNIEKMIKNKTK